MNDFNSCYDKKFMANYDNLPIVYINKKCQRLNCNNSYNIYPCVKCVKTGCLLNLFQKKYRIENLKILLQNNCINNSVTNALK